MDHLLRNPQTMPASSVIPILAYDDVEKAIDWLCTVFGFTERWRAGNHRAQLKFGNGGIVVIAAEKDNAQRSSIMVRVADVDSHYKHACEHGVHILQLPAEYPYGEKQYTVEDIGGHVWMFTQTIIDIMVENWGGKMT